MKIFWWGMMGVLLAGTAQAQLYRWVDETGRVHYTDQPPPATAKKVEEKKFTDNVVQTDKLPYAVQQAIKNNPVVLFTGDCGDACTTAKAYLVKRGIPYTERLPGKNPADLEEMRKVSKENLVPLLLIGRSVQLKGFNEDEWARALDSAGYPKAKAGAAANPATNNPPAANAPATPAANPKPY